MTIEQSAPAAGAVSHSSRQGRRIYAASFFGTTVEFYDFIAFGTAASLVFPQVFFDGTSEAVGTIASFATLAIGYTARPLGGLIGGHYGDRIGRKSVLIWTMAVMGVSTFLIGLLPSSAQIGSLAPVLLVVLRLVQGLAVGAEWGGAVLMSVEHAESSRRGLFGSATGVGSGCGVLLAYTAFGALGGLREEQFLSWGWRLPFLLSAVLIVIGMYIRLRIEESPVFLAQRAAAQETPARTPLVALLREGPLRVLAGIGLYAGPFMAQALVTTFLVSYATTTAGVPRQVLLNGLIISLAGMLLTVPLFAWLSDRVGRRIVYIPAALLAGVFSFFVYDLVATGSAVLITLVFVISMTFLNAATVGVVGSLLAELFPTRFRYTGASAAYQFAGLIGGGVGPLLASILSGSGAGILSVSIMTAVFCAISAVCAAALGDTRTVDLHRA
ncbi:MFS transporter [Streptomyces sp. NPDC002896]|uniref:MFS transporter n=1 Tax=Streptomyces sp. NPDC002896 TaxID=3154438 RepID=UPI00331B8953